MPSLKLVSNLKLTTTAYRRVMLQRWSAKMKPVKRIKCKLSCYVGGSRAVKRSGVREKSRGVSAIGGGGYLWCAVSAPSIEESI